VLCTPLSATRDKLPPNDTGNLASCMRTSGRTSPTASYTASFSAPVPSGTMVQLHRGCVACDQTTTSRITSRRRFGSGMCAGQLSDKQAVDLDAGDITELEDSRPTHPGGALA
jgi:hypothetical protein